MHLFICLFMYLCIYLFMAALGLRCCAPAFSSCGGQGLLFAAVRGLLTAVASLVVEQGLQVHGLQQLWCVRAQQLWFAGSRAQAQQLWRTGLVALRHVGSSRTRARTHVPCIGRRILNHCAIRDALVNNFLKLIFIGVQLLYSVVLVSTAQQSESAIRIYIYIYIPSFLDFPPIQVSKEHSVEFPELYSRFSLFIYFIHSINSVYMSIPISQFIPPQPGTNFKMEHNI